MTLEAREISVAGRLEGVSAALQPGAITAICGPNGAGKSSLLEALAGLLAPDAGEVVLDAAPLATLHPRERARRIGYLPQHGEVAWNLSVRSLAALGRLPHGDAAAENLPGLVVANNHFRGQAAVNAVEIRAALTGHPVPAPAELIRAYPRLAAVARPLPSAGDAAGRLF